MEVVVANQLPFHHILLYCDGETLLNALCVSTIYHSVVDSDIVKAVVRMRTEFDIEHVPIKYAML